MIQDHRLMLKDRIRTLSYKAAIEKLVRPGQTVVDLGTGTGILAFFACRAGAKKVYAIESSPYIVQARENARVNGLADKIRFLRGNSADIKLPEKADLVVSETMGSLGVDENILSTFLDAKKRFLKKNGTIIPSGIKVFMAPISAPAIYAKIAFWKKKRYGLDLLPQADMAANAPYDLKLKPGQYLAKAKSIFNIRFRSLSSDCLKKSCSFTVHRPGTLHGFAGWFEARLAPGIVLSNRPDWPKVHWSQRAFPVPEPVKVNKGDRVGFTLQILSVKKRFFWNWWVSVNRNWVKGPERIKRFELSTLRGHTLSLEDIRRQ